MALKFIDNINFNSKKPNFERDQFDTIADMVAFKEDYLPDTFIATCIEDGKAYLFNRANTEDETLGRWRPLVAGSGNGALSEDITTEVAIGGIEADTTFIAGTSLEDILTKLLTEKPQGTNKFYYGVSDDTTADFGVDTLYEVTKSTVSITANNQYVLFIFPADKEVGIFDTNGLNNTNCFTVSDFDISSIAYKVYCSEARITCTDFEYKITY